MKKILSLLLVLMSLNLYAQKPDTNTQSFQTGYAVIKGHIENNKEPFFEMAIERFLEQKQISIPVDANGNFSKKIKVEGDMMDIILPDLNQTIFVKDRDTIICKWDAKDPTHIFKASSKDAVTNDNLRIKCLLNNLWEQSASSMFDSVYSKNATDSSKFAAINNLYNKEFEIITKGEVNEGLQKIAVDTYFKYATFMIHRRLMPEYQLKLNRTNEKAKFIEVFAIPKPYTRECEEWFRSSSQYRDFLFDYLRLTNLLKSYSVKGTSEDYAKKTMVYSIPRNEYNSGLNALRIIELRDWYAAQTIIWSFRSYDYEDCVEIYKDFLNHVKTPYYADTIKQYYQNIKNLKPGMPAPEFTLKDEKGRQVSLSQFRGKIVYLDFWGVNCGPCLYDIKNKVPALHERYKNKNVVFINICVDSKEPVWKASLKTLKLNGVNLIAEGWDKHPTVKAYNVTGIPHYFLIDANGNFVDNNAPRPDPRMYEVLDKLVSNQ